MIRMQNSKLRFVLAGLALSCVITNPARGQGQPQSEQSPMTDASGKGGVAIFEDFAKYPPESRPLNSWNWDLLHPWLTESSSMSLVPVQTLRQLESLQDTSLAEEEISQRVSMPSSLPRYQFDLNKTIVAGIQDELVAQLTVTPQDDSNTPLRIHVTKVELIGDDYFGSPGLGSVPFSCETAKPVCTFQWRAPSTVKKYWGSLELDVTLTVEGMADEFVARASFYSSPMVAGSFTGNFRERVNNGSLMIDADVSVQKRMACFVSANLYSVDKDIPVQFAQRRLIMDPSMKSISFMFFGKIFRDRGDEGAFRLQDLKAQCENLSYPPEWFMDSLAHQEELQTFHTNHQTTMEPARVYFEYNTYSYVTRRYASNDFSDQEWKSPEKTRKLEALKKIAAELDDPALELRKRQ